MNSVNQLISQAVNSRVRESNRKSIVQIDDSSFNESVNLESVDSLYI